MTDIPSPIEQVHDLTRRLAEAQAAREAEAARADRAEAILADLDEALAFDARENGACDLAGVMHDRIRAAVARHRRQESGGGSRTGN